MNGLLEALDFFGEKRGVIVTFDQKEMVHIGEKEIMIVPLWEWLLQ